MAKLDRLFDVLLSEEGSDLHLLESQKPKIRVHGRLKEIDSEPVLDRDAMVSYLREIAPVDRWNTFLETRDIDFAYAKGQEARFRTNYYFHVHGMGAVFRIIPARVMTLKDLALPDVLKNFAQLRSGLVLITGPTGSGKSTTLAAIIDYINSNESRYILTIEEPIEFVHPRKKSVFCQREVGRDAPSFAEALRTASRQDCDVILVGEMRDYETIALAVSAASMGSLVFGTLHTNSAIKTVDRIIDVFPPEEQPKIRTMLSESLRGVCAQILLKKADGKGRVAALEILMGTQGLATSIREGNTSNIRNVIQGGRGNGMQLMDDSIETHLKAGLITGQEAYLKSHEKEKFIKYAA